MIEACCKVLPESLIVLKVLHRMGVREWDIVCVPLIFKNTIFTTRTLSFYAIPVHLIYGPNVTLLGANYNILNIFSEMKKNMIPILLKRTMRKRIMVLG